MRFALASVGLEGDGAATVKSGHFDRGGARSCCHIDCYKDTLVRVPYYVVPVLDASFFVISVHLKPK